MTSGTDVGVFDVWGFEGFEALAVGGAGTILHFDGAGWSPMPSGTSVDLSECGHRRTTLFAVGVGGPSSARRRPVGFSATHVKNLSAVRVPERHARPSATAALIHYAGAVDAGRCRCRLEILPTGAAPR
jgi:hypothetical protein